jgi:hypothetical protein
MFKTHRITERERERENSWLWRVCVVGNLVIPGRSIHLATIKTSPTPISSSGVRNGMFGNSNTLQYFSQQSFLSSKINQE